MTQGRLSVDLYWLGILAHVAGRSTCPRRAVGAILTDDRGAVLSTGYNGVSRGLPHCTENPCPGSQDRHGDTSRCLAVHAEMNAILSCHRLDLARVLYCSATPCFACAKCLLNTGVTKIVAESVYAGSNQEHLEFLERCIQLGRFEILVRDAVTNELRTL